MPPSQRQAAEEFGKAVGLRRRRVGAPVRRLFVADEDASKTPTAALLSGASGRGGGRGGQLRVKLYLSLLWVCGRQPYSTTRPASAFAALLGLPDYEVTGTRRVQQALRDLTDRNMVRLEPRRGSLSPRIHLLSDLGNGEPYESPVETHNRLSRREDVPTKELRRHEYFRVPSKFWIDGWVAKLQGPGLVMLLAMLSEQSAGSSEVWFSPTRAERRFHFSASTRKAGVQELRSSGAIEVSTRKVSLTGRLIDDRRRRNVYRVLIT